MTKFSANLGFLWTDQTLTNAIHAAKSAGFDAVECHWPYDIPAAEIVAALSETGLKCWESTHAEEMLKTVTADYPP